jgi:hypothetical protein
VRGNGFSLDEFQPDAAMASWAAEHVAGVNPLDPEIIAAFKDHHRSKGQVPANLPAAYRQWVRKEPEFLKRRGAPLEVVTSASVCRRLFGSGKIGRSRKG